MEVNRAPGNCLYRNITGLDTGCQENVHFPIEYSTKEDYEKT